MVRALPSKKISETITVEFNFADVLEWAEVLSDPVVTVGILSGLDDNPSTMISGSAAISGNAVTQGFTLGLGGVIYLLTCTVTGSSGSTYIKTRKLAVLTDDSSFAPGRTLSLSGSLPDGIANVAYSETLQIYGGYPPYEYDDVIAGAAPFWMGFSVDGTDLVCAGLPDETVTTEYTFTPQVEDATNTEADEPQVIRITHILISGDVPDGVTGESVSGAYTAEDATGTVTYAVTSGTFPSGLVLAPDGTYSGAFDTATTYSWEVTGTDSVGNTSTVADTAVVDGFIWLMAREDSELMYKATDPIAGPWTTTTRLNGSAFDDAYTVIPVAESSWLVMVQGLNIYRGVTLTPVGGGLPTSIIPIPIIPTEISVHDNIVFFTNTIGNSYNLSVDYGVSFTSYSVPNGLNSCGGLAQLDSGRWLLAYSDNSNPAGVLYTDDPVPSSAAIWTAVPFDGVTNSSGGKFVTCNGSVACAITHTGKIFRSTTGTSWTLVHTAANPSTDVRTGIAVEDVFVMPYGQLGHYSRSTDGGLSFTDLTFPAACTPEYLSHANGVMLMAATAAPLYYSLDLGLTWATLTLPFTPGEFEGVGTAPIRVAS